MKSKPSETLVDALAATLAVAPTDLPGIDRARQALAQATPNPAFRSALPERTAELVESLTSSSDGAALLHAVQAHAGSLDWRISYTHHDDLPELHAGYFVAAIVGLPGREGALLVSDVASLYLTIQEPNLVYPSHVHKAPELYHVISGTGMWQMGGRPFQPHAPGAWIVHPTGTRHAMETTNEPMLSLAIWTDDLDSVPVIVRD